MYQGFSLAGVVYFVVLFIFASCVQIPVFSMTSTSPHPLVSVLINTHLTKEMYCSLDYLVLIRFVSPLYCAVDLGAFIQFIACSREIRAQIAPRNLHIQN